MIRRAEISDIDQLVEWIWIILEDMELALLQEADMDTLKKMMKQAMEDKNYRYSYHRALISMREGERAGVCFGYKGELEPMIDEALNEKLALLGITEPLFEDPETVSGEWYLDSLVTDIKFRGQGVATELLKALPAIARSENEEVIGLNCDQLNQKAQQLYLSIGFEKVWECKLGEHLYDHMQWKIN
ncbi:GNAT family N-acetyltransferase [Carnobacterium alterfunditum]|uniref:GNAT family N-acetyltransferase n=1 Tax=Carnobacterium alterfunditum TaxID=28230 RepID=UPI00359404F6